MNDRGQDYFDEKGYPDFPVIPCVSDMTIDADAVTIPEALKPRLRRALEDAARRYFDLRRLEARAGQSARLRQELQLGLRLAAQLSALTPDAEQLGDERSSVGLSRAHVAALREGERRLEGADGARLAEAGEAVRYLRGVYEAALDACARRPGGAGEDAETVWRGELVRFYTRELARPWTGPDGAGGEAFIEDCRAGLAAGEAAAEDARAAPAAAAT